MKNIILNQRAERDELMARPYQQGDTRYNFDELLANPLIKIDIIVQHSLISYLIRGFAWRDIEID